MKKTLLWTAGMAVSLLGGQAMASTGYLDFSAARQNVDSTPDAPDADLYAVGGAFSTTGPVHIQLNGKVGLNDHDNKGASMVQEGAIHVYHQGPQFLFGVSVGESHFNDALLDGNTVANTALINGKVFGTENSAAGLPASDVTELTGTIEGKYYMGNVTLGAYASYGSINKLNLNTTGFGGDVAFFLNDNFRINGGIGMVKAEGTRVDPTLTTPPGAKLDNSVTMANIGAETKISGSFTVFGGYDYSDNSDADIKVGTLSLGVRYNFHGETLKHRDREGAGLGTAQGYLKSVMGL